MQPSPLPDKAPPLTPFPSQHRPHHPNPCCFPPAPARTATAAGSAAPRLRPRGWQSPSIVAAPAVLQTECGGSGHGGSRYGRGGKKHRGATGGGAGVGVGSSRGVRGRGRGGGRIDRSWKKRAPEGECAQPSPARGVTSAVGLNPCALKTRNRAPRSCFSSVQIAISCSQCAKIGAEFLEEHIFFPKRHQMCLPQESSCCLAHRNVRLISIFAPRNRDPCHA